MSRIAAIAVLLVPLLAGCNAMKEYEGEPPPPRPDIALDCATEPPPYEMTGFGVEHGSATGVAQRILARHGLRPDDEVTLEHGPWEPERAGIAVRRHGRTLGLVELEREEDGWLLRGLTLCEDFSR